MAQISIGSKLTFQETSDFVNSVNAIAEGGERELVIDMSSCQYLNSIMLSGLIRAQKICQNTHCNMALSNVNASAMTLFETTNVLGLFDIKNSQKQSNEQRIFQFDFEVTGNNIGIIKLTGSFDNSEQCTQFRNFYEKQITTVKHGILDCSNLSHLGTCGVTEFFRIRGIFQEREGELIIVSQTDSVESVWRMMHLESLIPKVATFEEAAALIHR